MKLRYERGALIDLDEIFAFIAADNRKAAARLVEEIEKTALLIAITPKIGTRTRKPSLRKFRSGHYLIVYEITKEEVVIHYVRHDAARDLGKVQVQTSKLATPKGRRLREIYIALNRCAVGNED